MQPSHRCTDTQKCFYKGWSVHGTVFQQVMNILQIIVASKHLFHNNKLDDDDNLMVQVGSCDQQPYLTVCISKSL